jgi:hypothetical protein
MTAILLTSLPAWAATVYVANSALVVDAEESGLKLQIPSVSYVHSYTCDIEATNYSKIVPLNSFYVTRSVDVAFKESTPGAVHLLKPARMIFSFDDIDFKRASQMNTNLSIGHFRIGRWNETKQNWDRLPSTIFWNGSTGLIEAETQDPGRYALLWSYENNPVLSPTAGDSIRVMVNYTNLNPEVAPYIKNGRTMIPLRAVADNLNVVVKWNDTEKRVDLINSKGTEVQLWIGKTGAFKDSKPLSIDAPPEIIGGRTFVPLRFVAEALGVKVTWDNFTRTAYLTTS